MIDQQDFWTILWVTSVALGWMMVVIYVLVRYWPARKDR